MRISVTSAIRSKLLVEIKRSVDGPTDIDGFVLAASKHWLLLSDVDDLWPNGYYLIRRDTIRSLSHIKSHVFRKRMVKREGVLADALLLPDIDIATISSVLSLLQEQGRFLIIWRETKRNCWRIHCRVQDQTETTAILRSFNGTGQWEPHSSRWPLSRITCIKFGSHYLRMFEKYAAKRST